MGWGAHPDTMSISMAQNAAKDAGQEPGTLGYLMAYRDAYAQNARRGSRGLAAYLAQMDAHIDAHYWAPGGFRPGVPPIRWDEWLSVKHPASARYAMTSRSAPSRLGVFLKRPWRALRHWWQNRHVDV